MPKNLFPEMPIELAEFITGETMTPQEAFDHPETYVPEHMRGAYMRYLEYGISPGSFGQACINGDLETASARADYINAAHVKSQIEWCRRYASKL